MESVNPVVSEREKYEKIYQFENYGKEGHGKKLFRYLKAHSGQSLADFGCGRGQSLQPYLKIGLRITAIDHVDVLSPEIRDRVSFLQANLWEDKLPTVDWGLCTDVMEHIPEEFVQKTLDNIHQSVRQGCLWTICHVQDVWGDKIGDRLHLTIKPLEWWLPKMKWKKVEVISNEMTSVILTEK